MYNTYGYDMRTIPAQGQFDQRFGPGFAMGPLGAGLLGLGAGFLGGSLLGGPGYAPGYGAGFGPGYGAFGPRPRPGFGYGGYGPRPGFGYGGYGVPGYGPGFY